MFGNDEIVCKHDRIRYTTDNIDLDKEGFQMTRKSHTLSNVFVNHVLELEILQMLKQSSALDQSCI